MKQLLTLLCFFSSILCFSTITEIDGWRWNLDRENMTASLLKGDGIVANVPSNVTVGTNKLRVTHIAGYAFSHSKSRVVRISNTVKTIEMEAFRNSRVEEVYLPNGLAKLEQFMFSGCNNLRKVKMPVTLKEIGSGAFENCQALRTVDIPSGVESIGSDAFCNSGIDSLIIPNSVTELGNFVCSGCNNLKFVRLSDNVTELAGTFSGCPSIVTVILGKGLKYIYRGVFDLDIQNIYCLSQEPPIVDSYDKIDKVKANLYVPAESIEKYKKAPWWGGFWNIHPLPSKLP